MTTSYTEQQAWQARAARVVLDLIDQAARDDLPSLNWTISDVGVNIVGRSTVHPTTDRGVAIRRWADALGIELGEHRSETLGTITLTGVAKQTDTKYGFATIVLTCDVYTDDEAEGEGN